MPNQYFRLDNTTSQDAFAVQYLSSVTKLSHEELMLKHKDLIEKTRVNIYNNNKEAIDYKNNSFRNDSLIEVDLDKVCNILRGSVLERKETVVQELPAKQIDYISSNSVRFLNNNLTDHIEINVKPSIKHSKTDFENSKIKTGLQINDDAKNQNEITKTVTCASAKFKYIHKNDRKFDFTIGSDFSNVLKPSPDRILNTIPGSISFETGVLNTNARLNTKLANNVSFSMDTNLRIKKFDPLDKDFLKIKPSQIIENSDLKITSGIKYEANGFHANGDIRYCIKKYDIKKNELTDGYEARVGVGYKYSLYENKNTKQSWQIFASASSTFENFEKHKKSLACLGILFKYKNLETKISLDGLYSNMIFMSGLNVAAEYTFEGKNANSEFKIGGQYNSVYIIAEDILKKKHEKITIEKIDYTIKSILLYTNEKIKKGFIDHPLYDLNKIGKNSSGQYFKDNDQSDPDLVKINDQFYYSEQTSNRKFDYSWNSVAQADNPHKYILRNPQGRTSSSNTNSTSSQSTNYVESQATKALKKQTNCNQAHDESNSDSVKSFANKLTNNNPAAAKFGHAVGSIASSSFTAGNGINYLLKDPNLSFDNPETLKALADTLVGGASALNGLVCFLGTSEKKEFFKLMNEFSHDGSNYSLKKFNTQLNALCQRNLTLGRKVTDFLGHFNKTIFWSVNCGHKDAFGPLAQTFKSSTHLCCDAYKIYKGSIDENGQYSADLALKSVHTNAHSFIKNGFTTIVAAKAAHGYSDFRNRSNGLDDIVTSNLDRIAAKNTPRLSNKQLKDALHAITSAEHSKLEAQKLANSKAAKAFKSIYVFGSATDGSSALSKDRLKYLQLNSQLSSGILDKATYDEKCKLLEYRAAIQFSITASELTLVACKISNPMGWSLAIIDFAASLAMPSKEQLDQALISKGLDPKLNPFQVDRFPIVELTAVLAIANGINGLTASLPETSAKYWDVVCELVLGRSANVFSEAASSYNETIQAERRSGNYLHNKM